MRTRMSIAGFVIIVSLCVWMPTAAGAVGTAQTGSRNVPASVALCQHGGWQSLSNMQGQPFRNQGQCISYFIHNPVSLADLSGSFSGTTTWTFGNGCPLVNQIFDASYPGSSAVGAVMLQVGGCVDVVTASQYSYTGTFTIATNVGTLSGNAAGLANVGVGAQPPVDFELTLTVVSGTGAFAATTGTIHVSIVWSVYVSGVPSTYPVTGSVTIP
jgi:hypothetical protein